MRCTANRKCSCLSIVRSCHRNSSSHSTFVHKLYPSDYLHQLLWIWRGNVYNKRECSSDEQCKSFKKIVSLWTRCNVLGSNGRLWTTFSRYRNCLRTNQNRTAVPNVRLHTRYKPCMWQLLSEVIFFSFFPLVKWSLFSSVSSLLIHADAKHFISRTSLIQI